MSRVDAEILLPGSKSLTNRALIAAALADGESRLDGVLRADDTEAMWEALRVLGVDTEIDDVRHAGVVRGTGGRLAPGPLDLDARESGTTARFLLPFVALGQGRYRLDAAPAMRARPMGPGIDAVRKLGVDVVEEGESGHLPVVVEAPGGSIHAAPLRLAGDVSSQFLSGLLLTGPRFDGGLLVSVEGDLVSRPYVDMTVAVMQAFGVRVDIEGATWHVPHQAYSATTYPIEPDASAASYFFAAAAITGGRIRVSGLGRNSLQGDLRFVDVLGDMGAEVHVGDEATEVRGTGTLHGVDVDLADLSDMAPTLAAVAAFADTPTSVTGIGFIRRKETDRVGNVVRELRRCGVDADEEPDGFVVRGGGRVHAARVHTYGDHRMAMSFALLGLPVPGVEVDDPSCVAKTFPTFWDAFARLGSGGVVDAR